VYIGAFRHKMILYDSLMGIASPWFACTKKWAGRGLPMFTIIEIPLMRNPK
jgi:hypothetical protein